MTASRTLLLICTFFLVILTILAGCIKPPESSSSGSSGGSSWFSGGEKGTSDGGGKNTGAGGSVANGKGASSGTSPSSTETNLMVPATPFASGTTPPTTSLYTRLPDPTPEVPEYVAIFFETLAFKQNKTAYTYALEHPPMIIEMCIKPNMTTRTIWYEDRPGGGKGKTGGKTQTVTTISPAAWFEVTVRDQASGSIVAQEGFAKSYGVENAKKLTIRSAGTYLVEFSGSDLSAEIRIRVPATGTQTGMPLGNMSCGTFLL